MRRRLFSLAAVVAVLASGCGDAAAPGAGSPGAADGGFPATISQGGRTVTVPSRPTRIVSLSSTATEVLFAIGAGPQVAAVDEMSNHPAGAPVTKLSGFQPSVEAVAAHRPDLVVIAFDPGAVTSGLEALGIPVLVHAAAATLDDAYAQIEQLGAATGRMGDAAALVGRIQGGLAEAVAGLPGRSRPLTYYYELDSTYFSASSTTFIGRVLGMLGLKSIADRADSGSGYPQLSAEYILAADPDLIFLADTKCCGQSAATVAARPGWSTLRAVRQGRVVALDDDIASRWGPRVVELARDAARAVAAVPVAAP